MTLIFQNVTAVFECIPLFFGISKKTTLKPPEEWNSGTQEEKQRKIGTKATTLNPIAYGNIFNQINIKDRHQGSKTNIVLGVDAKASAPSKVLLFFFLISIQKFSYCVLSRCTMPHKLGSLWYLFFPLP